jgi:hypothetical protein
MSACSMLTYSGVTPAVWTCIKNAVSPYIKNPPDSGTVTVDGFTIYWNYNPGAGTFQVQCTDSPWWAPCSAINGKINDVIEGCLSQSNAVQVKLVDA